MNVSNKLNTINTIYHTHTHTTADLFHNPKNFYLSSKYKQQVLARLVQQCQRRSTARYK